MHTQHWDYFQCLFFVSLSLSSHLVIKILQLPKNKTPFFAKIISGTTNYPSSTNHTLKALYRPARQHSNPTRFKYGMLNGKIRWTEDSITIVMRNLLQERCKSTNFSLMEFKDVEQLDNDVEVNVADVEPPKNDFVEISFHAILGHSVGATMKLQGSTNQPVAGFDPYG